jgi:hypothetical protein
MFIIITFVDWTVNMNYYQAYDTTDTNTRNRSLCCIQLFVQP